MKTIYSEPNLVTLQHDAALRCYAMHWQSYHGPHFRRAVEAMLADVKKNGLDAYISDASVAKDVPQPADFQWVESHVKAELVKGGIKKFITIIPASAIAKMGANRFGKVASNAGVETWQVASMAEALDAVTGRKAA
ncbi:MAG: hypothetical protein ACOZQL_21560 [Myxococcota bacterium]